MVNFGELSWTLKEQAGKIKFLGLLTIPIAIVLTFEIWRLPVLCHQLHRHAKCEHCNKSLHENK